MPECSARKGTGVICSKIIVEGRTLCRLHDNSKLRVGPFKFATNQLNLKHKFEKEVERIRLAPILLQIQDLPIGEARRQILDQYIAESQTFNRRHAREKRELKRQQNAEIAQNGGVNPDQEIINRRAVREVIRAWTAIYRRILIHVNINWDGPVEHYRQRIQAMLHGGAIGNEAIERLNLHLDFINADYQVIVQQRRDQNIVVGRPAVVAAIVQALNPNENLQAFAGDNQNVHTRIVVEQTKKNVQEILKIEVPSEYRWNMKSASMTFREIMYKCGLSPGAAWQFSAMYCSDATIYELENGIFGKVVDGVWQYICKSPDRPDLMRIFEAELRDNIGMCAQGNLSRICNVLSGYLDGIGQKQSVSTILGHEFPKLMEIENETERVFRGTEILRTNNVPESEWEAWLEPLRS